MYNMLKSPQAKKNTKKCPRSLAARCFKYRNNNKKKKKIDDWPAYTVKVLLNQIDFLTKNV